MFLGWTSVLLLVGYHVGVVHSFFVSNHLRPLTRSTNVVLPNYYSSNREGHEPDALSLARKQRAEVFHRNLMEARQENEAKEKIIAAVEALLLEKRRQKATELSPSDPEDDTVVAEQATFATIPALKEEEATVTSRSASNKGIREVGIKDDAAPSLVTISGDESSKIKTATTPVTTTLESSSKETTQAEVSEAIVSAEPTDADAVLSEAELEAEAALRFAEEILASIENDDLPQSSKSLFTVESLTGALVQTLNESVQKGSQAMAERLQQSLPVQSLWKTVVGWGSKTEEEPTATKDQTLASEATLAEQEERARQELENERQRLARLESFMMQSQPKVGGDDEADGRIEKKELSDSRASGISNSTTSTSNVPFFARPDEETS